MRLRGSFFIIVALTAVLALSNIELYGHCDTMNGPVITAAKRALESGDVKLVLIWVLPKDEAYITELFNKTLNIRKVNPEVKELAERYFFETLVRIHRAGEGEPFTGIKDSTEVEPPIAAADKALESGSLTDLLKMLKETVEHGVGEKFQIMIARKNYDRTNVEAGREFVESYVTFVHYVEGIYTAGTAGARQHDPESQSINETAQAAEKEQDQPVNLISDNSRDHLTNILIIAGVIIIISVQVLLNKRRS